MTLADKLNDRIIGDVIDQASLLQARRIPPQEFVAAWKK